MQQNKELPSIDLGELIDGQKAGRWIIGLMIISALLLITDGFDLAAIGYVGPELVKVWGVQRAQLTPVLTASTIGLLIGAPILSFIGDRFGRKVAILTGLATFGLMSLASAAATSLGQLTVLRFLTGIGLGGAIPNVAALLSEFTPRRLRGRFVVFIALGMAVGIGLSGRVAALLVPVYGWQVLLVIGGIVPLVLMVLVWVAVPESIQFLAVRGGRDAEVRRLARVLRPDLAIGDATRISTPVAQAAARGSVKRLFAHDLALVTPLLWITQTTNQVANFFSITWLPTFLQASGASTQQAGNMGSLFSVGGLVCGLCLMGVIDRIGVIPMVLLFVLGTPLVAMLTMAGLSPAEHSMVILAAGFCVVGLQTAITAIQSVIYPTPIRSTGIGWCQAAGRVGAIAGPIGIGALLAAKVPIEKMSYGPAMMMGIGALASIGLAILCVRRFGGTHLGEFRGAAEPAPVAARTEGTAAS